MFSYIKGILAEKSDGVAVVDVNGVGFKVYTSLNSLSNAKCIVGNEVTFHTYLYIKEGIMDLYGFCEKSELELFLLLISVNGVGAKGAVNILSVAPTEKLSLAIVTGDTSTIKSASGIGAKTAQRICLELKDKIKNESFVSENTDAFSSMPYIENNNISEAVSALVALGYTASEAQKAVKSAAPQDSVEDIIKHALKSLM